MMRIYIYSKEIQYKIMIKPLELDKDQLANNILELTINDDKKLIEAAIR